MVFVHHVLTDIKELTSSRQRLLGKALANPFMVEQITKIVWYSMHHSTHTEAWLLQSKRLAGKELSNPFIADDLLKIICPVSSKLVLIAEYCTTDIWKLSSGRRKVTDLQPLTKYQANPNESHLVAVKRISRYLKGTSSLGLWYPKGSGFDLKRYSDSDYAGCCLHRKSTSGSCQILGGKLVCWSAKKQNTVAMSSAEAAYVVAAGVFCG
ncbi:hypothetical protein Tco_0006814 [Tanacetum coccineum]